MHRCVSPEVCRLNEFINFLGSFLSGIDGLGVLCVLWWDWNTCLHARQFGGAGAGLAAFCSWVCSAVCTEEWCVCVGACRGSCGGMRSRLWRSLQLPIRFKPLGFFCWWEAAAGSQGSQELFVFLGSAKGFTLRETLGEGAAPQH